ncbi:MAG TPA: MarR family winged helix-turn-helix transcriptional regulator [Rhizomicrobium sp.]
MRRVSKLAIDSCDIVTFRRAAYRVSAFYDAQLAPCGLCISEFATLVRLCREKRVTFEAFFESSAEKRAVNRNLRRLTEAGLIQITKSPSGGCGIVTLTRRGLGTLRKAVPLWQAAQARFEVLNGPALRETLNRLVLEG